MRRSFAFVVVVCGTLSLGAPIGAQDYVYSAPDVDVEFNADTGAAAFTYSIEAVDESGGSYETQGYQLSFGFDGDVLTPGELSYGSAFDDLNDGAGPEFFNTSVEEAGIWIGMLYDSYPPFDLPTLVWDDPVVILEVELETDTKTFFDVIDEIDGGTTTIDLALDDFDSAPVTIKDIVVVDGLSYEAELENGTITLIPGGAEFRRGDVNGDGDVAGLLDALELLGWAFDDGDEPPCLAAADVDSNGAVSALTDALRLLAWSFSDGDAPPDPGPDDCGVDPNGLPCETEPDCD